MAELTAFEIPAHAELVTVTHLLELPKDLGLARESVFVIVEPRNDGLFESWPDEARAQFIGLAELPRPNVSPVLKLVFRRAYVPERAPLVAAHTAFENWVVDLAPNSETESFRELRDGFVSNGSFGWVTVVAATRFVRASSFPSDLEGRTTILGRELDASLATLNDFIVALSLTRRDPSIVPVARGDLPFVCPVLLETAPSPDGLRHGTSVAYPIHEHARIHYGDDRDEMDEAEVLAGELSRSRYHQGQPYFLFYELMQQAIGQATEARYRAAALSTGTAVEVLFGTSIRLAAEARGLQHDEIGRLLSLPLRNLIVDHLSRFADCVVDLTDPQNPFGRWWSGGYAIRNRVAHEGYSPTRSDVHEALDGASNVVRTLRAALLANDDTEAVGQSLQWGSTDDDA
jgi:hypothetical protein